MELSKEQEMLLILKYNKDELNQILFLLVEANIEHQRGDDYIKLCTKVRNKLPKHLKEGLRRENKLYFQKEYNDIMEAMYEMQEVEDQIVDE